MTSFSEYKNHSNNYFPFLDEQFSPCCFKSNTKILRHFLESIYFNELLRGFARYNSSSQQLLILLLISCLISLFGVLTPDRISFIINNFINLHSTFPGHGRRDGKIGLLIWSFYLYSLNMLPRQEKNSIKIKNIKLSWQCYYLVVYFYTDVSVALTLSLD